MAGSNVNSIGAGQCGTLIAIMPARQGLVVGVFERSRDPRISDARAGHSINLALAARGPGRAAGAAIARLPPIDTVRSDLAFRRS